MAENILHRAFREQIEVLGCALVVETVRTDLIEQMPKGDRLLLRVKVQPQTNELVVAYGDQDIPLAQHVFDLINHGGIIPVIFAGDALADSEDAAQRIFEIATQNGLGKTCYIATDAEKARNQFVKLHAASERSNYSRDEIIFLKRPKELEEKGVWIDKRGKIKSWHIGSQQGMFVPDDCLVRSGTKIGDKCMEQVAKVVELAGNYAEAIIAAVPIKSGPAPTTGTGRKTLTLRPKKPTMPERKMFVVVQRRR